MTTSLSHDQLVVAAVGTIVCVLFFAYLAAKIKIERLWICYWGIVITLVILVYYVSSMKH